jgi:hypothetical protein
LTTNTYAHANNPMLRDMLLDTTVRVHRETHLSYVIIGDLNCTPVEGAVARFLANGAAHEFGLYKTTSRHAKTATERSITPWPVWTTAVL